MPSLGSKEPGSREKDNRTKTNWTRKRKGKVPLQSIGPPEKEIHWKCPIHPTVRGGFLGGAGPNRSLTPATLNALEPDPGDNPSRDPSTDPPLQTVQWTKENQISTGTGPPSAEWQTETPMVQEKIGVTPTPCRKGGP